MPFPIVLNGVTYNEADFDNLGYVAMLSNAVFGLLTQVVKGYASTSASTIVLGAGLLNTTVTITTATGLAWLPGDVVVVASTAAPAIRGVIGVVTSYITGTGVMMFTCTWVSGTGTLSAWQIFPGGAAPLQNVNNPYTTGIIPFEAGGTGFGGLDGPTQVQSAGLTTGNQGIVPGALLGFGSPRTSMEEIYEDFVGFTDAQNVNYSNKLPPPWQLLNTTNSSLGNTEQAAPVAALNDSLYFGGLQIIPVTVAQASALLSYNTGGFFHVGRGYTVYETVLDNLLGAGFYSFRFGLAAQNSGYNNIFGYGGIGFEGFSADVGLTGAYANGVIVCTAGASGKVVRIASGILPTAGSQRFRIEIDHMAYAATFFVNDVQVAQLITGLPITDYRNLLYPAYEVPPNKAAFAAGPANSIIVDACYLRKTVSR